jgi:tetratricopeptide (TPR) repeat protein
MKGAVGPTHTGRITDRKMQMGSDIANPEQQALRALAFVEALRPELYSPRNATALDRLEHERGQLRQARDYFLEHGDGARVERMIGALRDFWWRQKRFAEAEEWIASVLATPELPAATRAAVLDHAGGLAYGRDDYQAAHRYFSESLAIRREIGPPANIAQSLIHLAVIVRWGQGDATAARALYEEALHRVGPDHGIPARLGTVCGLGRRPGPPPSYALPCRRWSAAA